MLREFSEIIDNANDYRYGSNYQGNMELSTSCDACVVCIQLHITLFYVCIFIFCMLVYSNPFYKAGLKPVPHLF